MKPLHPKVGAGEDLAAWLETAPGRYLLDWERQRYAQTVADVFGYHALQLGLPQLPALEANRMPHRWVAVPEVWRGPLPAGAALVTHAAALPFPESSIDMLVLPHTLELSADPHAVLREVERVLRPDGRLIVSGLNPASLWGWRQYRARACAQLGLTHARWARPYLPQAGAFIGPWRLKDWLELLNFDIEHAAMGVYRPAVRSEKWLQRWQWMDRWGARWWPFLGAAYFLVAVKRVRGMHLLGPAWKPSRRAAAAPVAVAQRPSLQVPHQKVHRRGGP